MITRSEQKDNYAKTLYFNLLNCLMSSESEWEPPSTAEGSDSDWEPVPRKKRKLNKKASKPRLKATKKRIQTIASVQSMQTKPRRRRRQRRALKPTPQQCPPLPDVVDSDTDIEMLEHQNSKSRTSSNRKRSARSSETSERLCSKKKRTRSSKKRKDRAQSSKSAKGTKKPRKSTKSSKSTKCSKTKRGSVASAKCKKSHFKAGPNRSVDIPNLDMLICGLFRSLIPSKVDKNRADAMPRDVTNLVDEYHRNIMYFNVNFVWTHKYACCLSYARCKIIKGNRGQYVFEREPTNEFDSNAVKIMTVTGQRVGHIPRQQAATVAAMMDIGKIELKSAGGEKGYPCREMVEIIPLQPLTTREYGSLRCLPLESAPFDENRYVTAVPCSLSD